MPCAGFVADTGEDRARVSGILADALVVVFTPGMSLRAWEAAGLLEREWAIYERLASSYGRLVLVTFGGRDEAALAATLNPRVGLVCNDSGLDEARYAGTLAERVAGLLKSSQSVVVKTNQLPSGPSAVRIAGGLREAEPERRVALVARGGYLHSRFVAYERGPQSPEAARAAAEEQELCAAADVVVGTTREMLEDLSWRYAVDPAALRLVPNYVLTDRDPALGEERQNGVVLYSGQLTRRKRVDLLIRAVAGLPESLKAGVTLRIIGRGPEESRLKALGAELAVRCDFQPRIPHRELLEQMSSCTIYAQASELEGHPKTVLEAMAAGAPVIVADSTGLGVVVQNGVTGLRVSPDTETFANAIGALLADPEWRRMLGSAAARAVRDACGIDRVVGLELGAHGLALERCGAGGRIGAGARGWARGSAA